MSDFENKLKANVGDVTKVYGEDADGNQAKMSLAKLLGQAIASASGTDRTKLKTLITDLVNTAGADPTLINLSLSPATVASGAAPGTVVGTISGKHPWSTLSVIPNDGRFVVDSSGNLVVGLTRSRPTTRNIVLRETLGNFQRDTAVVVVVSDPAAAYLSRRLNGARVYSSVENANYEAGLGRPTDFIHMFCENNNGATTMAQNVAITQQLTVDYAWAVTAGKRFDWAVPGCSNTESMISAANGALDSYYLAMAQIIAAFDKSDVVIVRLPWEANHRNAFPWSFNKTGVDPETFKAMWIRMVNIFRSVSGRFRFAYVIVPNATHYSLTGVADAFLGYPGDAYVDMIGCDPYYNSQDDGDSGARAFRAKRTGPAGLDVCLAFALAHGKAFCLPEVGQNTNSPDYLECIFAYVRDIANFTHIGYWNQGTTTNGSFACQLWPSNQYPLASAAMQRMVGPLQVLTPATFTAPPGVLTLQLEANRRVTWKIIGGANAADFAIAAGILVSNPMANGSTYVVTCQGTDENGFTITRTFTIPCQTGSLQPETQFGISRMATAPVAAIQAADDAWIVAMKASGDWFTKDVWYMSQKDTEQACFVNFRSAGTRYDLTKVGTPGFTARKGLAGTGAAGNYYSTGYTPSVYGRQATTRSLLLEFHSMTALLNGGAQSTDIGCDVSLLFNRSTTPALTGREGNNGTVTLAPAATSYPGRAVGKIKDTARNFASKGVETYSNTFTPDDLMDYPVTIGGSPVPGVWGVNQIAYLGIGDPASYAREASLKVVADNWLTAVAAAA